MTNLGNRIKWRREELNISLSQLALTCEVSKSALHDIENKHPIQPSAAVLYRIAAALGMTIEEILDKPPLGPQTPVEAKAMLAENTKLRRRLEAIRKAIKESE